MNISTSCFVTLRVFSRSAAVLLRVSRWMRLRTIISATNLINRALAWLRFLFSTNSAMNEAMCCCAVRVMRHCSVARSRFKISISSSCV